MRLSIRHFKYIGGNYIYLALILIFATVIIASGVWITRKNALKAVEDSLKLQALGIAVSLEASLKDNYELRIKNSELRKQKNIFKEIITEGKWEGIAFIALYDKTGRIILHSNENLIGRRISDNFITDAAKTGNPLHRYVTLGTDERVFILYFPARVRNDVMILMIALHTYPVEGIVRQARVHTVGMIAVMAILWVTGALFIRMSKHSDELKSRMAERERLAVIGEMASVLAHEIRNPLGSIKGFAQYLREHNPDGSVEYLDIIISESRRLEVLTEDLLMYAKPIEILPVEFNLLELVRETLRSFDNEVLGKNISISLTGGDFSVRADREKVKQIILNLIHNAADAVDDGGEIAVKVAMENGKGVIIVKDNGCGMDEADAAKVFQPFFTTKTRGTGLGLAIVDKLIKAMGGNVTVESAPGKGTVFTVEIPRSQP